MVTALLITLSLGQAWGVGTYSGLPRRAQTFGIPSVADAGVDAGTPDAGADAGTSDGGIASLNVGLLAYYSFNGNVNDPVSGLNGAATNLSYVVGISQDAGLFDSSTQVKVDLPSSIQPANFTVSAWIYGSLFNGRIYSNGFENYPTAFCGFNLVVDAFSRLSTAVGSCTGYAADVNYKQITRVDTVPGSVWNHVVVSYDGATLKLYQNNTSDSAAWAGGSVYAGTNRVSIGYARVTIFGGDTDTGFLTGYVDELGVWSRALTDAEVALLYNGGAGRFYPF